MLINYVIVLSGIPSADEDNTKRVGNTEFLFKIGAITASTSFWVQTCFRSLHARQFIWRDMARRLCVTCTPGVCSGAFKLKSGLRRELLCDPCLGVRTEGQTEGECQQEQVKGSRR